MFGQVFAIDGKWARQIFLLCRHIYRNGYNHAMIQPDDEVGRVLKFLRNKIYDQQFTQLEVQEALSWGRSYISQLMTRQKKLRVDQVFSILGVIGVDPREFFAELYQLQLMEEGERGEHAGAAISGEVEELRREVADLRRLTRRLVGLLVRKEVISSGEIREEAR